VLLVVRTALVRDSGNLTMNSVTGMVFRDFCYKLYVILATANYESD
jgi:hypothetical protein